MWSTALQLSFLTLSVQAQAQSYYDGASSTLVNTDIVLNRIHAGQILIVSELHSQEAHHMNQAEILKSLIRKGLKFSVGMEFFNYPDQELVNQFFYDEISEDNFLEKINWQNVPFDFYRFLVRIPKYIGGKTVALNLPRSITAKISQGGLSSASPEEQALFPPQFTMGQSSYFERFKVIMKDHVSVEKIPNYFISQSLWDDTMAWRAQSFLEQHPNQVLVIIVGDFHVAYQDGLISRLRARGAKDILSISQIDTTGATDSERAEMIEPSSTYGVRADFIFDIH